MNRLHFSLVGPIIIDMITITLLVLPIASITAWVLIDGIRPRYTARERARRSLQK